MRKFSALLVALVAGATAASVVPAGAAEVSASAQARAATTASNVAPLGPDTVLFLNNRRIESTQHLRRTYVQGRKVNLPGLSAGRVNIEKVTKYGGALALSDTLDGDVDVDNSRIFGVETVLQETDALGRPFYRMYTRTGTNVGYRESRDGINWKVRHPDTVVIVKGLQTGQVEYDPAAKRYYLFGFDPKARVYRQYESLDGFNFHRSLVFSGMLSTLPGDIIHTAMNPDNRSLLAIAKQGTARGTTCQSRVAYSGGRAFGVNISPASLINFLGVRDWRAPVNPLTADCVDALSVRPISGITRPVQIYGNPFQKYGDQYIAMPWVLRQTTLPPPDKPSGWVDGPLDSQIAGTTNPARTAWRRATPTKIVDGRRTRPPLIARGANGSWDDGMIFAQPRITTIGGRSAIYYTGWNDTHLPRAGRLANVGMATWRKDSFVGLSHISGRPASWMTTRPFRISDKGARTLRVNGVFGRSTLRVAVLDARTGKPIPGYAAARSTPVSGSKIAREVTWGRKKLSNLGTDRAIQLRFIWGAGTLYSYKVS